MNDQNEKMNTARIAVIGAVIVFVILVVGTIVMATMAGKDTVDAVHAVSLLYLDELAGRREQVVENNLQGRINDLNVAVELMTDEDLSDEAHLQAYQAKMRKLYRLEKFAFVDTDGLIYTADGTQTNIDDYGFDYKSISGPEISILNLETTDKRVIIAVPVALTLEGKNLIVCFMQIDMDEMLSGVSMESSEDDATFCNIYTKDGIALSDTVLGGLAVEDNLLEAMQHAEFDDGYSYDQFIGEFESCSKGEVSFTYNNISETLSYVPVEGTDWLLTYLIRESVITEKIGSITVGIIIRSVVQSLLMILALVIMFAFIMNQNKKNAKERIELEAAEAASRAKQEEMAERLELQNKLLEEEKQRTQQSSMINALSADYWSVYYLDLDSNEGVCYQVHSDVDDGFKLGEHFRYLEAVTAYANKYICEQYRDDFLAFIQPDAIREGLKERNVISYTYMVNRHGHDSYEQVRFAGVRKPHERDDNIVHNVGACFVDVDEETRSQMIQKEALSDALAVAEEASKAKTAFLSNMSHEIRTPMNAIIGLDNIAMNDPDISDQTREYLEKIEASADHLLQLINDILDMSRIESGRMIFRHEEFSFSKLLETINTMFSSQCQDAGLDYQCHINGHIDNYYVGDNMKLRQVLINILGNAVKFTPEGGKVEMEVERTAHFDDLTTLRFRISDTGIGISEEFLPRLFDTFAQEDASSTNKYGSSGLGLAIAKNIVEMMNGSIQVESRKGEGTTFIVTVTLNDSDRNDMDDMDRTGEVSPSEMNVLIVDDDSMACEHAKLVLEKAGISTEIAESGHQAIEMVSLRHARREPYNLILVDWKMPDMDGVETTKKIREISGTESAIIMLTAYRWDDVLEEALAAGVDSFIPKPLFAATVMDEFRAAMDRRTAAMRTQMHRAELKGRRILVAEDVAVNAEIMKMILKVREMESDVAVNGREAVERFSASPAGYYDAILMDVRMPEMDGLEATRRIRALDREDAKIIPIIALTANAFDEDVQRSLQAGMDAHLTKPIRQEVLYETLEGLIRD